MLLTLSLGCSRRRKTYYRRDTKETWVVGVPVLCEVCSSYRSRLSRVGAGPVTLSGPLSPLTVCENSSIKLSYINLKRFQIHTTYSTFHYSSNSIFTLTSQNNRSSSSSDTTTFEIILSSIVNGSQVYSSLTLYFFSLWSAQELLDLSWVAKWIDTSEFA